MSDKVFKEKDFTKEAVEKAVKSVFDQPMEELPAGSVLTGKEGAILHMVILKQVLSGRKLTDEEREEYEAKLRDELEIGAYRITPLRGIEYLGLWDSSKKDGHYLIKREDKYYVEEWKNGVRVRWGKITDERFEELKKITNAEGSEDQV